MNRDCLGDLVCLHAHQLPSSLLYISQYNPIAFTCGKKTIPVLKKLCCVITIPACLNDVNITFFYIAEPDVPHTLLEDILQSELPTDIFAANVSGNDTSPNLVDSMHNLLAAQLGVS